jgi:short subunit dehydrogenase-like uncharacterized protein
MTPFLLYGSNGYTGTLIAELAVRRGLVPILAGRNAEAVARQAAALGLQHRAFALEDRAALDAALSEVALVVHAAGPFSRTAQPMADACLRVRRHYLDITGEIAVFEALAARDSEAKAAGVMLLPGVGFDVVPSDCLAAHVKSRLPTATRLTLAFLALGRPSRGTATTVVENLWKGGMVRSGGRLVPVPPAHKTRRFDFGERSAQAITIPWGDVSTAYYSTGIPDIEVFSATGAVARRAARIGRRLGPALALLGTPLVQRLILKGIKAGPPGPSPAQRARARSLLVAEAEDAAGQRVVSRLSAPEGYTLTADSTLRSVEAVGAGRIRPGFATPSLAFGKDFVLELDGVTRTDL